MYVAKKAPVGKILIVHQHFRTPQEGGAVRSYYLAKALVDSGVHTVVVTACNEGTRSTRIVDGIHVCYLPVSYENRFGFYRRLLSFYGFTRAAVKVAAEHRDADVVYAISTPLSTGLAARSIKRRYGVPYVFEVGDLWPDVPIEMGIIRNSFLKELLYRVERTIYSDASVIVALSESIREGIAKKISGKQIHLIPNMADTVSFRPTKKGRKLEEKFDSIGRFVVSYIGALGLANGLHHFLNCAAVSQTDGLPVRFIVCGAGAMEGELKSHARKMGLTNLMFVPFRNREGVQEVMSVTDANFISYLPVEILQTGSPNKYFDGLAAGKLTIINFRGWIKDEIEREQCGVFVDPKDPADFVRKLRPFLEEDKLKTFGEHARALAERKYSRKNLGAQYADLLVGFIRRRNNK